jgi:hypothetical protein
VLLRALEDGVQPTVAAQPGEGPFNPPADAGRDEPSVASAGNRLDGDAERLTVVGQQLAPLAKIAERCTLEATLGEGAQNRHDAFRVMPVRRRDIDRQRHAVSINGNMDFDAPDLPSAVDPAVKAARRRATGSAIDLTTALGSGASPQARRQVRRNRSSSRRQRPSRVHRTNRP